MDGSISGTIRWARADFEPTAQDQPLTRQGLFTIVVAYVQETPGNPGPPPTLGNVTFQTRRTVGQAGPIASLPNGDFAAPYKVDGVPAGEPLLVRVDVGDAFGNFNVLN
jgi:hypothetical protein